MNAYSSSNAPRPSAGPSNSRAGYMAQPQPGMGAMGMGIAPPPQQQQAYKGTLPPGTKVAVGNITVTVKRYLSEGGFAHVYLVTSSQPIPIPLSSAGSVGASTSGLASRATRPETVHVLKRMAVPDKDALATVRSEVEAHKLLRNQPNIVHFIEASATALSSGGYEIFILMEYCPGGGIIDLMNARLRDRLREHEILKIFSDVCAGVAVMHHLDPPLMHRDLKVENILLSPAPADNPSIGPTYKLCDFGSAAPVLSRRAPKSLDEIKRVEADLNRSTTLQYRAPEMVDVYQRRVIDEKSDIWALGVLLYKLCYYTTPFEENGGGPLAILSANYRFPPSPVYSQNLKNLIASLLREQSTDRPTIDQVLIRVHRLLGSKPPAAAMHYAQQLTDGKQVTPLPNVVFISSSSSSVTAAAVASGRQAMGPPPPQQQQQPVQRHPMRSFDDTTIINSASCAASATASGGLSVRSRVSDLIQHAQAGDEEARRKAEVDALKDSVIPMRRGRPVKGAAAAASSGAAVSAKPVMRQLTGERNVVDDGGKGAADMAAFGGSATVGRNFDLPFSAQAAGSSSKSSILFGGFEDSFTPTAAALSPSQGVSQQVSGNSTASSPAATGNTSARSAMLLNHSPEMPGFHSPSLAPSLSFSPKPPGLSPQASATAGIHRTQPAGSVSSLSKTFGEATSRSGANGDREDDASNRFPSVKELDARYAPNAHGDVTSPILSPPIVASSPAPSVEVAPPSLPPRDRHKPPLSIPTSVSPRQSVGAMASRFNSSVSPAADKTCSSYSPTGTTTKGAAGLLADRWPRGIKGGLMSPSSSASAAQADRRPAQPEEFDRSNVKDRTHPPPACAPPRDWLTGDDTDDAIVTKLAPASSEAANAQPVDAHVALTAALESDSGDEPEEPEDVGGSALARKYARQPEGLSSPQQGDADKAAGTTPHRVKTPSWLVETTADVAPSRQKSSKRLESVPSKIHGAVGAVDSAPSAAAAADDFADEDDRDLAVIEGRLPSERKQVPAPAWDEMDETEMRALPQQPMSLSDGHTNMPAADALPPHTKPAAGPAQVAPPPAQMATLKQYVDAATSPPPSAIDAFAPADKVDVQAPTFAPDASKVEGEWSASPPSARTPTISERMHELQVAASSSQPITPDTRSSPVASVGGASVRDRYKPQSHKTAVASSSVNGNGRHEPQVILPRLVQTRRDNSSALIAAAKRASAAAPASSLKPWEREAAAAAEFNRAGVVKSTSSAAGADAAHDDDEAGGPSPATASHHLGSGSIAGASEAQERFRGVSDLISKWQANAKAQAPGWGRIGETAGSSNHTASSGATAGGMGALRAGPNLGEAAADVGSKRTSSVLPRSATTHRLPGTDI
ncbi:hypothetical protein K437DRAFT_59823 [Tilletiaria anomala UBC 951]|uniref:non-specific serine/threonine protein kinase n=1 Tax=Tilletiaria anomala (strain ATCC 24038 / CBS 436.72 / UBC 951) TaxID=1037660 RepID=A0A066WA32_TILAU|nr:uncharacterized protein K437DRAFT_59823 [Tilletiaria anomala UBC 951]KDN50812.1 hypothetical protein K437DRAFT_59823 [Tilletiaria anomala UBC 951]